MKNWEKIEFFKRGEFVRNGYDFSDVMSWRFITALDAVRRESGFRIEISRHRHALGRFGSKFKRSDHHLTREDFVNNEEVLEVADIMPYELLPSGGKKALTLEQAERFYRIAIKHGINAIGAYPMWSPRPGFHFAMRHLSPNKRLASWSAIPEPVNYEGRIERKQVYYAMAIGMDLWPNQMSNE